MGERVILIDSIRIDSMDGWDGMGWEGLGWDSRFRTQYSNFRTQLSGYRTHSKPGIFILSWEYSILQPD